MPLKEVFCQDKAISILQRAYTAGKMPHAYIFAGQEGVGKLTTARQWAKLLLCKQPLLQNNFADSCGRCHSCRLFDADSHPDFNLVYKELREFTKDGKGKPPPVKLPIDVIREFLIEKISTRPTLSKRKVFVITEAEKLNDESQNALLKSLEEPPEYCSIILLCTGTENLFSTIKSRCQKICFGPIDEERIIDKLKEIALDETCATYFARLAQGSLGAACQWARLDQTEANLYQIKKEVVDSFCSSSLADSLSRAQDMSAKARKIAASWYNLAKGVSKSDITRRAQKTIIQIVISTLHDAMNLNVAPNRQIINFDQNSQIQKLSKRFDPEAAAEKIAHACKAMRWIDAAVNEKLIFEQLLLNLACSDIMKI
ncbi:MAG: DNA polymerase III subunit [Planctomycetota bacterium]|jgi:DNA polymerase III delta' subunit